MELFKQIKTRVRSRFSAGRLTLKSRLAIVFTGLMLLSILFSSALLFDQRQIAVRGTDELIRANAQMVGAIQLRETLSSLNPGNQESRREPSEVNLFGQYLTELKVRVASPGERENLNRISRLFGSFLDAWRNSKFADKPEVHARYDEVNRAIDDNIAKSQDLIAQSVGTIQAERARSVRETAFFLILFLLVIVVAGFKIIGNITEPLSALTKFLDDIDVENNLPNGLVGFLPRVPEISLVARSFDQLLKRLNGYRALNVRRLLIEKRRADIIAASISDGIFLLRGDEIVYINPTAGRILNVKLGTSQISASGVVFSGISLGGSPASDPAFKALRSAMTQTLPVEFEMEVDGRKLYYLIRAYPISYDLIERVEHSVNRAVQGVLGKFQADILILAQDVTLVRESQEAKSHFVATLAHEVKTPVTSLTMATRLLKKSIDQVPNARDRALIMTCVDEVDRLRVLLKDLLTVSSFDTLTQRLEIQTVDFSKLMKHAVQSFQFQAEERGIQVSQRSAAGTKGPIMVPMDPSKIAWAFSNLLTNALGRSPREGRIEVVLEAKDEWIEVRVADLGPPVDRNRRERIFDHKLETYYDIRAERSVGVGLAIAREIVAAHGGRIWVAEKDGNATEFCFTIPLKREAVAPMTSNSFMKGAMSGTSSRS